MRYETCDWSLLREGSFGACLTFSIYSYMKSFLFCFGAWGWGVIVLLNVVMACCLTIWDQNIIIRNNEINDLQKIYGFLSACIVLIFNFQSSTGYVTC